MEYHRRLIVLILAVILLASLFIRGRRNADPPASPAAFSVPAPAAILVAVSGDVAHPGIIQISANDVTASAIKMAEPLRLITTYFPKGLAELSPENGTELRVSIHGGVANLVITPLPVSQCLLLGIPLDLNRVTAADLDRLPGVGPALAEAIVEYRHNNGGMMAKEELINVSGIGERKLQLLKKYFK